MSEWFYIRLALGLTWAVFGIMLVVLIRRTAAAERALRELEEDGVR